MQNMDIDQYIKYWDCVIDEWLGKKGCGSNVLKKEKDVWLNGNSKVSQEDMPEPYWGYPQKGSVVILNYNPAGGFNKNRMTTKLCAQCSKIPSLINYVFKHQYSQIANPFPLIYKSSDDEINKSIEGYEGADWWNKKQEWLNSWLIDNNACPFVMELCAWHSKEWKDIKYERVIKNPQARMHIQETVVSPLIDAVTRSGNVAFCIGKQFDTFLTTFGFNEIKNLNISGIKYINGKGWQPCNKERYYRVYKKDGIYVINTWSVGSNQSPSKAFFSFEKDLRNFLLKRKP